MKELRKLDENYWLRKIDSYRELPEKDPLLKTFLIKHLKVDQKNASIDAHGLEKSLSNLTLIRLKKYIYFLENRKDQYNFDTPKDVERFIKE